MAYCKDSCTTTSSASWDELEEPSWTRVVSLQMIFCSLPVGYTV